MATINVDEIQRDFLGYLRRVQAGETLVILQADKPVAELKPVTTRGRERRPFGLCAGEFRVPDDFNDPLPEEVLRQFEGS
ncbi:type II toxin-antitoxin system Phd/YefM family antitoxin [Acidobacteria bacterium AH-259-L09]|nr:type II toxin-antitoxin system Phd/YefM family antitoxin [Acidobacteria bacterium AH-259-L09]